MTDFDQSAEGGQKQTRASSGGCFIYAERPNQSRDKALKFSDFDANQKADKNT